MADKKQLHRLKQKYITEVMPALKKEFKISNDFAVPQIKKIVINMGVTKPLEVRPRTQAIENVVKQFSVISGQKPQITTAKQSIAGFKLRAGDPVGVSVTLRGLNMWEFLDKLISITLPRVKDFRGIPTANFDGQGNYSLGIEEQIVFPEISYDDIESIRSLQVNIVTSSKDNQQALKLLTLMGMPFEKEEEDNK